MADINLSYTDLKTLIANKNLQWQYTEYTDSYHIFAADYSVSYYTTLHKSGYEPLGCNCSSDRTDFETNYKSGANTPLTDEPIRTKTIIYGQKNVTTAGTAVILMTSTIKTSMVAIKAKLTNTGNIYVGDSAVTSSNGFILEPGGTVGLTHDHSKANIYLNSDVNGEGVSYIGGNR